DVARRELVGADLERLDRAVHGRVGQPTMRRKPLAQPDDARKGVDDAELAGPAGNGNEQPAIVGAEVERGIRRLVARSRAPGWRALALARRTCLGPGRRCGGLRIGEGRLRWCARRRRRDNLRRVSRHRRVARARRNVARTRENLAAAPALAPAALGRRHARLLSGAGGGWTGGGRRTRLLRRLACWRTAEFGVFHLRCPSAPREPDLMRTGTQQTLIMLRWQNNSIR